VTLAVTISRCPIVIVKATKDHDRRRYLMAEHVSNEPLLDDDNEFEDDNPEDLMGDELDERDDSEEEVDDDPAG
jgi:hypothetical protein